MNILLIEDERILAELIRLFLQSQGHTITLAVDGQAGIDSYMHSLGSNYLFDLVITDYRMPIKDGGQVVKEILSVKPSQKIILSTAFSIDYVNAPTNIPTERVHVLKKPYDFDELEKLIETLFQKQVAR
jgi:CheY-like chemotaxis protein